MTVIHFTPRSRSIDPLCDPTLRQPVTRVIHDVTCNACLIQHRHREANKNRGGHPRRGDKKVGAMYPAEVVEAIDKIAPKGDRADWLRKVAERVALDSRTEAVDRAVRDLVAAGWATFTREAGDPLTVAEIGDIVQTTFQSLPAWQSIPAEPTGRTP